MKRLLLWLCIAICSELAIQLIIQIFQMIFQEAGGEFILTCFADLMIAFVAILGIHFCWKSLQQMSYS